MGLFRSIRLRIAEKIEGAPIQSESRWIGNMKVRAVGDSVQVAVRTDAKTHYKPHEAREIAGAFIAAAQAAELIAAGRAAR